MSELIACLSVLLSICQFCSHAGKKRGEMEKRLSVCSEGAGRACHHSGSAATGPICQSAETGHTGSWHGRALLASPSPSCTQLSLSAYIMLLPSVLASHPHPLFIFPPYSFLSEASQMKLSYLKYLFTVRKIKFMFFNKFTHYPSPIFSNHYLIFCPSSFWQHEWNANKVLESWMCSGI